MYFLNTHDILSKILWIFIVKFCAQFATQIYALFCKFLDVWLNLFGLLSFYEETRPHLVDFHNTQEDFMFSKTKIICMLFIKFSGRMFGKNEPVTRLCNPLPPLKLLLPPGLETRLTFTEYVYPYILIRI